LICRIVSSAWSLKVRTAQGSRDCPGKPVCFAASCCQISSVRRSLERGAPKKVLMRPILCLGRIEPVIRAGHPLWDSREAKRDAATVLRFPESRLTKAPATPSRCKPATSSASARPPMSKAFATTPNLAAAQVPRHIRTLPAPAQRPPSRRLRSPRRFPPERPARARSRVL
jgi:hypothetical protein